MKKSLSFLGAIFLLFSLALPLKAEKTTIKIIDGIPVVFNPKNPDPLKGTASKLVLNEILSKKRIFL